MSEDKTKEPKEEKKIFISETDGINELNDEQLSNVTGGIVVSLSNNPLYGTGSITHHLTVGESLYEQEATDDDTIGGGVR